MSDSRPYFSQRLWQQQEAEQEDKDIPTIISAADRLRQLADTKHGRAAKKLRRASERAFEAVEALRRFPADD